MKTLILVRHAKSSWDDPRLDDFDRPLNGRGRLSAPAIGAWLRDLGYAPDQALVSASVRTRQTWDLLALESCAPSYARALYHASGFGLRTALSRATGDRVLMLAHNPGIGELASELAAGLPQDPDLARFPTCAAAVFEFAITDWRDLPQRAHRLAGFTLPRRLLDPA